MALEAGGYAEKLGNRYEANWIAYQLLRLLEEKISWVTVEPLGEDEVGVDLVVGLLDNQYEYHQCKASNGNDEYWKLSSLIQLNILKNAQYQIGRGTSEFHLVSPLTCKKLTDLADSATNSNGVAQDFISYQINASKERKKDFKAICEHLGFDIGSDPGIEKAMYFLQKLKITPYVMNAHTLCELKDKAAYLFSDAPSQLIAFLKNYPVAFDKLRNKITTHDLLADLRSEGFTLRLVPDDERVSSVIENLSTDFKESIKPHLISNKLITRAELGAATNSIDQNAITLIKAEAGMGKSALLLELHEKLILEKVISVPIRLDRKRPELNADEFGRSLGFLYSPILSLSKFASDQKIVIILDQLDAIRWTATHSNNALQVCQELVRQVLSLRDSGANISIVMASRNFDLNEDIALSSWIESLTDNVQEIDIVKLDDSVVESLISPYEKYVGLTDEKKKILQIPLWLSIYLTIAQQTNLPPQFRNKLELVRNYWEDRLSQTNAYAISVEDAKALIDEIVVLMTSKSCLSISENLLSLGSRKILLALLSVGLLTKQSNRISFRHQALFDFQVGTKLFKAGLSSTEKLLDEIGDFRQQTLTKREHLKYALNMLLDGGQEEFCSSVTAVLFSENIRFHLKYLAMNSIKEMNHLTKPAKLMIDQIMERTELLNKFLSTSCYKNQNIISYLSESGVVSQWLNSSNEEMINTAIRLLKSVVEALPILVIKELRPFVGKTKIWNNRVYNGLSWNIEEDSEEMFELRLELFSLGCRVDFIDWKGLAKKCPERALILIKKMLNHYEPVLCLPLFSPSAEAIKSFTKKDNWSAAEFDETENLAKVIPAKLITELLNEISRIINNLDDELMSKHWLYRDRYSNIEPARNLTNGVISLIVLSGEQLSSNPDTLMALIKPYIGGTDPVITHLVAKLLLCLPLEHANVVIEWLLQAPKSRFRCGNKYREPEWYLPGRLIEKFSTECSIELFEALEKEIYYSEPTKDIEKIRMCLERRRQGWYSSYWGETQYFLLPKLSEKRVTGQTKQLIGVLNRKFSNHLENDFCSVLSFRGGLVTSPLPQGNYLSNKSWIKLLQTPAEKINSHNWNQINEDVVSEVSVEKFAQTLDTAVRNEPKRFALLALQLPKHIDKEYIKAFYMGLSETNPSRVLEEDKNNWQPCSIELAESVIAYFGFEGCEHAIVRLLESRANENSWSDVSIALLGNLAKSANDPSPDVLNVYDSKKGNNSNTADASTLAGNAINCVRGMAYFGFSKIFWKDESFALANKGLIDSAIEDPHPAVNIACIDLLLPILNYDNPYAQKKFLELCNKDLRMTGGRGAHHFFNQGFEGEYQNDFANLVIRMLGSSQEEVQQEAGRQVYARWFFNDLFEDRIDQVLSGNINQRRGCASTIRQFLENDMYHEKILKLETAYQTFVNDEDIEILRTVGGCIRSENYWTKQNFRTLFDIFVRSKAANHCLIDLFEALEDYSGSLTDLSDFLLSLVSNLASEKIKNNSSSAFGIRDTSLISVLQRLYDEAVEDEDKTTINTCLDIWDKLLESEIYTAISAVDKLDNGLLS